jgi:hypothetical protein
MGLVAMSRAFYYNKYIFFGAINCVFDIGGAGGCYTMIKTQTETSKSGKVPAGISLSKQARDLADMIKAKKGVSRTAVIEMAIREMAEKEGLQMPE